MKERNKKSLDLIDRTRERVIAKFDKMKKMFAKKPGWKGALWPFEPVT